MIYGMYLSATGVMTAAHKQDVIANNIANAETAGFKRDLALYQERRMARDEPFVTMEMVVPATVRRTGGPGFQDKLFDPLGGGTLVSPTFTDFSRGNAESTGSPLDAAIIGDGFFTVRTGEGDIRLTRTGQFMVDRDGTLILANGRRDVVLDRGFSPIRVDFSKPVELNDDGLITQGGRPVATINLRHVEDKTTLEKVGENLLAHADPQSLAPADGLLRVGALERSNVDPAVELTTLIETQRLLEANANMIRYQDQTLGRLVNEVGKVS